VKLVNAFSVAASVDETWGTLLDVPRVARALPGATIGAEREAGTWGGTMTVRLGPVTAEYAGTARLEEVDEDARVARFRVEGREARGQGTAAATIAVRAAPDGDGRCRVTVETDLRVTGRQAQLGHGLMEDVAGAILGEFAARLERDLRGEPDVAAPAEGEALDLGAAVRGPLVARAATFAAGLVVGALLGAALAARRGRAAPGWDAVRVRPWAPVRRGRSLGLGLGRGRRTASGWPGRARA
jgi:hypothetical protein